MLTLTEGIDKAIFCLWRLLTACPQKDTLSLPNTGEFSHPHILVIPLAVKGYNEGKMFYKGTWYICAKNRHHRNPVKGAKKKYQAQGSMSTGKNKGRMHPSRDGIWGQGKSTGWRFEAKKAGKREGHLEEFVVRRRRKVGLFLLTVAVEVLRQGK